MKKNLMKMLLFFLGLSLFVVSCDDDDDPAVTFTAPTLTAPGAATVQVGQSGNLEFNLGIDPALTTATLAATSSDEAVLTVSAPATVSASGAVSVAWNAVSVGSATVTLSVTAGGQTQSATVDVTVVEATDAPTITAPAATATVEVDQTAALSFAYTLDADVTGTIAAVSSDEAVLTVSPASTDVTASGTADITWVAVAAGESTVTATITDSNGGTATATVVVTVTEATGGAMVTFTVAVPAEGNPNNEDIFIAGNFPAGEWQEPGTNEDFRMTDNGDGTWSIELEVQEEGQEFKFFRAGGWATGMVDATCGALGNLILADLLDESSMTVTYEVAAWEDTCTTGGGGDGAAAPWVGDLTVVDVGYNTRSGTAVLDPNDPNILIVSANFPGASSADDDGFCDIPLTFIPNGDDVTSGTIMTGQFEAYTPDCTANEDEVFIYEILAGTYDHSTQLIIIDYDFYRESDGVSIWTGSTEITPGAPDGVRMIGKYKDIK